MTQMLKLPKTLSPLPTISMLLAIDTEEKVKLSVKKRKLGGKKHILELKVTVDEIKQFPEWARMWNADKGKVVNLKIDP